jgi:hypothetical protein
MAMRKFLAALLFITGVAAVALPSGQTPQPRTRQLELSFDNEGRVTLAAQGVTVREILAEWQRKGGSQFVNLERLTGPAIAVPIRFDNQPELEVLKSLLASAAGVIAAPRAVDAPGASRLGTVMILASSTPTSSTSTSFGPSPSSNTRQIAPPPVTPGSPTDELPPVRPPAAGQDPASTPGAPGANAPAPPRPGGFQPVNIVPITPVGGSGTTTGRGGGGGTTPPGTGRGGGGGGGGR